MGYGNILVPLQRLEDLESSLKDIAIPLLKDDWSEDNGVYKQTVLVEGLKADSTPSIMLSTVGEATEEELNAYACLDNFIVEDGSITFVASAIPSISFTVIAKGVIASEGQAIADVTALVSKVNELETEIDGLNSDLETKSEVVRNGLMLTRQGKKRKLDFFGVNFLEGGNLLTLNENDRPSETVVNLIMVTQTNSRLIAYAMVLPSGLMPTVCFTANSSSISTPTINDQAYGTLEWYVP